MDPIFDQSQSVAAPEPADGEKLARTLKGRGFSDDEVDSWRGQMTDTLKQRKFSDDEIRDFWGNQPPDMSKTKAAIKNNMAAQAPTTTTQKPGHETIDASPRPVEAKDIMDSLAAGYAGSFSGLFSRGEASPIQLPENASIAQYFAASASGFLGDSPAMVAGGVAGAAGGPIAAAAAAWAAPKLFNKALIDQYQNDRGDVDKLSVIQRLVGAGWEGMKGAATGAASAAVGGNIAAVNALGSPLVKALSGTATQIGAEVGAQTLVSSALEGKLPSKRDFINGAAAVAGLHGVGYGIGKAGYITEKLQNIFAQTGAHPGEVIEAANKDPVLKTELLSGNADLPKEAAPDVPQKLPDKIEDMDIPDGDHVLYQGVRSGNLDGKNGASGWFTKNLDEAQGYANADGPGGKIRVTSSSNMPDGTFSDAEGNTQSPDDFFKTTDKASTINPGDVKILGEFDAKSKSKEFTSAEQMVEDAKEHLLSRYGKAVEPDEPGMAGKARAAFDEAYRNSLDYTASLKDSINEIKDQPLDEKNAHVIQRLLPSVEPKTREFLQIGTRDSLFGKFNGESYEAVLNDYKKSSGDADLSNWDAYGIAARAVELGKRGLDQGVDLDKAKAFLDANKEIAPFFQRKVDFHNRVVDYFQKSECISEETANSWKELNQQYTSFAKVMEQDPITGEMPSGSRAIKAIGSSDLQIVDPRISAIKDTRKMIQLAHENYAKTRYVDQKLGEDGALIRVSDNQQGTPSDSQIGVLRAGKRTLYDVPKDVAESLNGMAGNRPALEMYLNLMGPWAKVERVLTVDNPLFAPLHAFRQQLTAGTLSKTNYIPFITSLQYLPKYLMGAAENFNTSRGHGDYENLSKAGRAYVDAVSDGAFQTSVLPMQSWADGQIESLNKDLPFISKAYNQIKTVGEFSHYMITAHDNLIRFAEQQRMLEKTGDRASAAFAAREVLPDIEKMGLQHSAILQFTPFLRVHLLGQARAFQEGGEDTGAYIRKNLTYITIPSLLFAAANRNDDAIEDLPKWEKWGYWNWHNSDWRNANSDAEFNSVMSAYPSNTRTLPDGTRQVNDGEITRFQKPFTNGILFGSGIEAAMESFKKKDPAAFEDYIKTVVGSLGADMIPPPLKVPLEMAMNYNSYTGQPIMRQSMLDKVPEMRYDRNTSETAKKLAGFFQSLPVIGKSDKLASPAMIDFLLHSFGSGSYMATSAIDTAIRAGGFSPEDRSAPKTWSETPGARQFLFRTPNVHAESVDQFEENFKQADQIFKSFRAAPKMDPYGESGLNAKLMMNYEAAIPRLTNIHNYMMRLQQNITGLDLVKGMTGAEKRQMSDRMTYEIISMAHEGNQVINDLKDKGN